MFMIGLCSGVIICSGIIYYNVQKETKEKLRYIDKYYSTLRFAVKNLPKEKYEQLIKELDK